MVFRYVYKASGFMYCLFYAGGKEEHHGLVRRPGHMYIRTGCLNKFVKHFGKTSLVLSRVNLTPGTDWAEHYYKEESIKSDMDASHLWT